MRAILLTALTLFAWPVYATQDSVSVAIRPEVVEVGKPFRYDVTMTTYGSGDLGLASAPGFGDLEVLRRDEFPQFITINNVSQRVLTVSWTLRGRKKGTYVISPPQVRLAGETATAASATINIVEAGKVPKEVRQKNEQLFLEVSVTPRERVYVGQQVNATYAVFNDVRFFDPQIRAASDPALDAFWVEPFDERRAGQRQSMPVNGRLMERTLLRNYALFPLRPGPATIDPMEVTVVTGGFLGAGREMQTASDAIEIDVLPLPPSPVGFYDGNVGTYAVAAAADRTATRVGDNITLKLSVTGEGLINRVRLPDLPNIEHVRVSPPKENVVKATRRERVTGTKTVEYVLTPTRPGTLTIPAIAFVHFDPSRAEYVTSTTTPIILSVGQGTLPPEAAPVTPVSRAATTQSADDLIHEAASGLMPPQGAALASSREGALVDGLRWAMFALLALLALAWLEVPWRRWKTRTEPRRLKLRRYQESMQATLGAQSPDELVKSVRTCLGEAFALTPGQMAPAKLATELTNLGVDSGSAADLADVLKALDAARYTPSGTPPDFPELRRRAGNALGSAKNIATKLAGLLAALVGSAVVFAAPSEALAQSASELASRGDFLNAAQIWRTQANQSGEAGDHLSAGLAFAKADRWGDARAELERAQFLAPGNAMVGEQLALVRNVVRLKAIEATRVGRVIDGDDELFWWRLACKIAPLWSRATAIALLALALLALAGWRLRQLDRLRVPAVALTLASLLVVTVEFWATHTVASVDVVVLLEADATFRDGPSELASARKVRGVTEGTVLRATEVRSGWVQVMLTNEKDTAWVPSSSVYAIRGGRG